ncbi:hypothetical protein AYI69_g8395 [Smittium culicis]|uniref:Retrovirus-related Pol polyprotein from transposon n=1 Tax=Smittium culicis TaxID=133412 RepID=A0A1R1XJU5_9FUNG|nr:hypothetical protein AYI69_g8395 [Smittium culicis]
MSQFDNLKSPAFSNASAASGIPDMAPGSSNAPIFKVPIFRAEITSIRRINLLKKGSKINKVPDSAAKPSSSGENTWNFNNKNFEKIKRDDDPEIKPVPDDMKTLIKQMGAMSLATQKLEEKVQSNQVPPRLTPACSQFSKPKCAYCDGEHLKRDCAILSQDISNYVVKIGEKGMVTNLNGIPYPFNFNRGGNKSLIKIEKGIHGKLVYIDNDDQIAPIRNVDHAPIAEVEFSKLVNTFAATRGGKKTTRIFEPYLEKSPPITGEVVDLDEIPMDRLGRDKIEMNKTIENSFKDRLYKIKSNIVDSSLQERVLEKCKESKIEISLIELASVPPMIRKSINDDFRPKRVVIAENITTGTSIPNNKPMGTDDWKTEYLAVGSGRALGRLQGAEVSLLFYEGSEVNIMSTEVYSALKSLDRVVLDDSISCNLIDANQGSSKMLGVCNHVEVEVTGAIVRVPIFVSENTKTQVIMGRPWDIKSRVLKDNRADGSLWYTVRDEITGAASSFCVNDMRDHRRYKNNLLSSRSGKSNTSQILICIQPNEGPSEYCTEVMTRYKSVGKKVVPVPKALKDSKSPSILQSDKFSEVKTEILNSERLDNLVIGDGKLSPSMISYFKTALQSCDRAFSFTPEEMGMLNENVESPIKVETVEHIPWMHKPYPIPKGIQEEVKKLIKSKIQAGILGSSNGSYSNRWFCFKKNYGSSLRFIQDVRPANAVTVRNSGGPPVIDVFSEDFSGLKIYSSFDLLSGYDQIPLDESSRDIFGLLTPFELLRMTRLPMG